MKTLDTLVKLSHNIRLYVPSTIDVNLAIDTQSYVDDAMSLMSELFGGTTVYNVVGGWLSDTVGLVKENVTIVESYASSLDNLGQIIEFAERMKTALSQEAIALEVDNELYLI